MATSNSTTILISRSAKHFKNLPSGPVSDHANAAALTLSVTITVYAIFRQFIFEKWLLHWLYGTIYTDMKKILPGKNNERIRRGFVNHHMSAVAKVIMFCIGVAPLFWVTCGNSDFDTCFGGSCHIKVGDVFVVLFQIMVTMYAFELCYRTVSLVSFLHHVGTIIIGEFAIYLSQLYDQEKSAKVEFLLCLWWGFFDLIAEFWPHIAMILYRIYPNNHTLLKRAFFCAAALTIAGTITETMMIFYLFGSVWSQWTLPFMIATPILHCIFSAAQVWGSWKEYNMGKNQQRLEREGDAKRRDRNIESGLGSETSLASKHDEMDDVEPEKGDKTVS
ncbi:hypothetical protein K432DRAFT_300738 [Lepidopterella palustris CBS 459.81]|uniref:TLC domain-containing protein n=1 Tax=Lepidopterella palustris CBS 459.81 TaxID=1314670 RepID=A0A8E2E7X8_9PEZI|nr:hypothetical protein K432DRAFT_300738 [Lepidopterella palustris CBS 459.81]